MSTATTAVLAATGASAYWFVTVWLVCAAVAGAIAVRKGYPEHWGLASGLILLPVGVLAWLVVPAKPNSAWKRDGVFPPRRAPRAAGGRRRGGADGDAGGDASEPAG